MGEKEKGDGKADDAEELPRAEFLLERTQFFSKVVAAENGVLFKIHQVQSSKPRCSSEARCRVDREVCQDRRRGSSVGEVVPVPKRNLRDRSAIDWGGSNTRTTLNKERLKVIAKERVPKLKSAKVWSFTIKHRFFLQIILEQMADVVEWRDNTKSFTKNDMHRLFCLVMSSRITKVP